MRGYKRVRDVQQFVRVRPMREYIRHVSLRVPRGIQVGRLGWKLHGYRRMRESSIVPVRHVCEYSGEIHMQVSALLRVGRSWKRLRRCVILSCDKILSFFERHPFQKFNFLSNSSIFKDFLNLPRKSFQVFKRKF